MKTLLIDNYDSFTYNLAHLIAEVNKEEAIVVRNDQYSWAELERLNADNIIISPGPGSAERPADFGVSADAIRLSKIPLLGVCLGHQGIAVFSGGAVDRAPMPMHGKTSLVRHGGSGIFAGIPSPINVARYHSLVVRDALPEDLEAIAWTADGLIMALAHRRRPLWGVQFHPESIITEHGQKLIENFRDLTKSSRSTSPSRVSHGTADRVTVKASSRLAHWQELPIDPNIAEAAFRKLCTSPAAYWLDSSSTEHGRARWSYLGDVSGPNDVCVTYRTVERRLEVTNERGVQRSTESIFDFLERERAGAPRNPPPCPFVGGFVGCFGYELRNECGSLTRRRAEMPDAIFMRSDRFVAIDHATDRAYIVAIDQPEESLRSKQWVSETVAVLQSLDANHRPNLFPETATGTSFRLNRCRSGYMADIEQCLDWIFAGETYQVCLTNEISCSLVPDSLELYSALRRINPAPYGAFLKWPHFALLSASPERFLRLDRGGAVETKPIKGTIRRDSDPLLDRELADELRQSTKDQSENVMIVDLLRNDISRVCEPGSVIVPKLFDVESYATVHQLVSTVRGQLAAGRSAIDLVRATFPGGSMTGAPKLRTMEFIDRLENRPRGFYSGALGWLGDDGAADLSIVIRTIAMSPNRLTIGVGGGIVAQSTPEGEFAEMLLKAQASIRAIMIAQGGESRPHQFDLLGSE